MTAAVGPERPGGLPVLVVDDEESLRHLLRLILERHGYGVVEARDGEEALGVLGARGDIRVVFCDIRMPRMDGLSFLDAVSGRDVRVVMMSAYGNTDTAVECLGRGAYDYITKPFRVDEVRVCLERIVERERLVAENQQLRQQQQQQVKDPHVLHGFIGRSEAARRVMETVRKVAGYPTTVLFTGESGTGKELLANALHALSPRAEGPFVPVNCAALPENLLESELFGHEKGAFTGAVRAHAGLFEQAHGGTILLDEIGDMPLALQTRLLRVLEDGRVRRIGGSRDVGVDVRVVAATAMDLDRAVMEGRFRQDLFYRLNVVRVRLPSLRERREDIPLLADALIRRAARRLGSAVVGASSEVLEVLCSHPWPGNVRQLENALEYAVLMSSGSVVLLADLPVDVYSAAGDGEDVPGLLVEVGGDASAAAAEAEAEAEDLSIKRRVAALEYLLITTALRRTGGNRSQAARLLELSYKALLYKIRDYGIEV